jgi:WD40 repeat protein
VSFSPDGGNLLATASDKEIILWDAVAGNSLLRWEAVAGKSQLVTDLNKQGINILQDLKNRGNDISPDQVYKQIHAMTFNPHKRQIIIAVDNQVLTLDIKTTRNLSERRILGRDNDTPSDNINAEDKINAKGDVIFQTDLFNLNSKTDVHCVAISPDGKLLAMSDKDGLTEVWEMETKKWLFDVTNDNSRGSVRAISFSQDGRTLGMTHENGFITLWDVKSSGSKLLISFPYHKPLSGSKPETKINDSKKSPESESEIESYSQFPLTAIAISSRRSQPVTTSLNNRNEDSTRPPVEVLHVAAASEDGTAQIWEIENMSKPGEGELLRGHTGSVNSISFSPDGETLVTGSDDKTAKMWNVKTYQELFTLSGHPDQLKAVAFSPDGSRIATGSEDGATKIWSANVGHRASVEGVAFNTYADRLATVSIDGKVVVWDVNSQDEVLEFSNVKPREKNRSVSKSRVITSPHTGISFSPDGRLLAVTSNGQTSIWNAEIGQIIGAVSHVGSYSCAISADGRYLATVGLANIDANNSPDNAPNVIIWDLNSLKQKYSLNGDAKGVYAVAFSPDNKRLATIGEDRLAKVWDFKAEKLLLTLPGPTTEEGKGIKAIAFSPDEKTLAIASEDKKIRLWDIDSQQQRGPGWDVSESVNAIAFNDKGTFLATALDNFTAAIWDIRTHKKLSVWSGHKGDVRAVSFIKKEWGGSSADCLVTTSSDNSIIVHHLEVDELISTALTRITRTWLLDECEKAISDASVCAGDERILPKLIAANQSAAQGDVKWADKVYQDVYQDVKEDSLSFYLPQRSSAESIAFNSYIQRSRNIRMNKTQETSSKFLPEELSLLSSLEDNFTRWSLARELVMIGETLVRKQSSDEGVTLTENDMKVALQAFEKAKEIYRKVSKKTDKPLPAAVTARHLNNLCWYGALWGYPVDVLPTCFEAAQMGSAEVEEDLLPLDALGVDMALLAVEAERDRSGLIKKLRQLQGVPPSNNPSTKEIQQWISKLENNENPFRDLAIINFARFKDWIENQDVTKERDKWILGLKSNKNPFFDDKLKQQQRQ